jgi:hypothetical protein
MTCGFKDLCGVSFLFISPCSTVNSFDFQAEYIPSIKDIL